MTTHAHRPGTSGHIAGFLPAYLNGTLALAGPGAPTSSAIAAHLRACPTCRQDLAAWTAIAHAVPAVPAIATPSTPSPGALDALMAAIDTPPRPQPLAPRATPAQIPQERPMADSIAVRPPLPSGRWTWTKTRIGSLGLIAAVLLLIASVAITSAPDPDPPRLPAIAAASPAATAPSDPSAQSLSVKIVPSTEAIDIAECTTKPRPPGTGAGLLAAQTATPSLELPRSDEVGTEPSAETLAGIDATLRQIVACRYADFETFVAAERDGADYLDVLDGPTFALYSDAWMAGLVAEIDREDGDGLNVIRTPFSPIDSAVLVRLSAVQLRDGSVRVSLRNPSGYVRTPYDAMETMEMRFVLQDGRWLVDDYWWESPTRADDYSATPDPSAPAAPQVLRVIVGFEAVVAEPWNEEERFVAGRETIVSVANLRDVPLEFAFPSLNFSVTVDPGHSVDLLLTDLVGIHPIDAVPAGGADLIDSSLILWPDQSTPTP